MAKKDKTTIAASEYDYATTKVVGKDGKTKASIGNGDAVQRAMLKFSAAGKDLMQLVRANKLTDRLDEKKYDNKGLFRMALGNALRGLVRNGTHVVIGDVTVKSLDQRVALDEVKDGAKPAKAKKAAKRPRKAKSAASEAPAEAA